MRSRSTKTSTTDTYNMGEMVFVEVFLLVLLRGLALTLVSAVSGHHHHPHHSLFADKVALLAFKETVVYNSKSVLANWSEANEVCNFPGVICDRHHHRVFQLNLSHGDLTGPLSPIISNLTALRVLSLSANNFYGKIPHELSSLRHLQILSLEENNLNGSAPESLALLSNLQVLTLQKNRLAGTISPSLFSNCTQLGNLDLSQNFLWGEIPREIGNCQGIWSLNLYNNQLTGELPVSITNFSSLYSIDLEYNHFYGELPASIVGKLTNLVNLHLSYNNMMSHDNNTNLETFFSALGNCTNLEELELAGMNLGGSLPSSIGRLSGKLHTLLLHENRIFGLIPSNIAKLANLTLLNLTSNSLNGTIPAEISQLSNLEQLFLSHNFFTGTIPAELGHCPHLGLLDLSNNQLSGEIPASLGNLIRMSYLFLNNNNLSGSIPAKLGQCIVLYKLDLSYNRLTGRIPPEVAGLRDLQLFLNLSHNLLTGLLPIELSKLQFVEEIDLSSNMLTGNIFFQISKCIALKVIKLSHNSLEGHLPSSLDELKNLESFDVSENHLSGVIPASLNRSQTLRFLNLSANNFEGKIPAGGIFNVVTSMSFIGNPRLCGEIPGMSTCSQHWFRSRMFLIIFITVIIISGLLATTCCVVGIRRIKLMISSRISVRTEIDRQPSSPDFIHNFPRITHKELSEATGGFDEQSLVGSGSYGHVYRGTLADGTPIAVKVLHVRSGNSTKSFSRECQVLKRIRHRNLIRIITACSLPDFKALVLPYMANGSLESRLYPHSETGLGSGSSDLTLIQRVNICSDVAEGMAYLHHHSPFRVIHCDLKPSNVLLNDDMTALVSDFGIARLVLSAGGGNSGVVIETMGNTTANSLCGSIGYIAPEYGFGTDTSTKGDVYSFGILVLEMVTRKRPIDDMFNDGLNLHRWVKIHYHGRVEKVIDSTLLRASRHEPPEVKKMMEVAIGELIELGILCTQESPSTRPTMLDAADDLDRLKRYLSGDTTATFASSLGISSSTVGDDDY